MLSAYGIVRKNRATLAGLRTTNAVVNYYQVMARASIIKRENVLIMVVTAIWPNRSN